MPRGKERPKCTIEGCDRPHEGLGLCKQHYQWQYRHGSVEDPRERRFWSNVDKDSGAPCWWWKGYIHPEGYGLFGHKRAHRITYEKLVGPIPDGLVLDHLCRVRHCVNPDHLEPVTPRENLRRGEQGQCWGYVPPAPAPRPVPAVECMEDGCVKTPYKRGLCRPHYRRWLADPERTSAALTARSQTVEERFWAKVDRRGPADCWLWTASLSGGYGQFSPRRGTVTKAHLFAYRLFFGPVPDGLEVHHVCQERRCVNPRHLDAATRSENIRARVVRAPL